jgi:probable HAF family extracellular repeat protein
MKCTALHLCAFLALPLISFGQSRTSALPAAGYTITDLGTLGGTTSMANAINNSGQIAGTSTTAGDVASHAFRYSGGSLQDLGTLGGSNSYGNAINNEGVVAGGAYTTSDPVGLDPCYWSPSSGIHDLGPYSYVPNGQAFAINDHGHLVGTAVNDSGVGFDAFGWTSTKLYVDLGYLGGRVSEAHGIDSSGQVVGWSNVGGDYNVLPFIWTSAIGIRPLAVFAGGYNGNALAINNATHVVGWGLKSGQIHAALWIKGQPRPQDLGTLGGTTSEANAINNSDVVVGYSLPATGATTHAFIWTSAEGMLDLNTLIEPGSSWELVVANGVNDSGQIVGNGTINGYTHGFLLTPAN